MRHIKLFENFSTGPGTIHELLYPAPEYRHTKSKGPAALSTIKAELDYYAYPEKSDDEKARIQAKAEKIYGKIKYVPNLLMDTYNNDGSPELLFHTSGEKFTKFKTPAFFASRSGAYSGEYDYMCVASVKNMLDLRRTQYKDKSDWLELVRSIFADSDLADQLDGIIEFADKYEDSYGFFKLVDQGMFKPYRWDVVFEYMKKNKYDGAVLRESDQAISSYFDGYIIMESKQIQILSVRHNEDEM
jgi:hypothetical protein